MLNIGQRKTFQDPLFRFAGSDPQTLHPNPVGSRNTTMNGIKPSADTDSTASRESGEKDNGEIDAADPPAAMVKEETDLDGNAQGQPPQGQADVDGDGDGDGDGDDELAEKYKDKGNELFKQNHFIHAEEEYSRAIDASTPTNPNLHIYYSNRSFTQLRLENYGSAIIDAEKAIDLKANFTKAYYRRGCAYMCLQKWKDALKDFQAVTKMGGGLDADAAARLKECQKQVREQKFAEAISIDRTKPASETVDPMSIEVDASYKGPHYRSGSIDKEFFHQLTEYIKTPGNVLHRRYAYMMVLDIIRLLRTVPTLVRVDLQPQEEFTICGDVHGQYYDMLNIFKINGPPSETNPYLFNGDFVDRGSFSVEVILALFAGKLLYPNHFHLARGNHEAQSMNRMYGFHGEVIKKYDEKLYDLCTEAFNLLPLAHVINNKILVVHGGLFSKDGVKLSDIASIDRNREPPDEGLMVELLWSDPQKLDGRAPSKRGVGVAFGPDVTERFLKENNLDLLVRSHEMKEEGYEEECNGKLVTVFSAPNYCDQMGNKGAFMRIKGNNLKPRYTQFDAVEHPPVRAMEYATPFLNMLGGGGAGGGGGMMNMLRKGG
ncbi:unnamed protein product [Vitrella brassicaformis CCMP3155]|uniref:Serine/threonine-protein phosphatase T n=2 Tax=Vitrella brassicaformis TaxID=1169539 RepID=A0A0G4FQT8_VITBC|nr:unnamed protein product [Vitrella brassicaformis CCMP3155]|eukprot:CEM16823.1 unnamed protein product [Vitrella brassicaformis CCMP3155]